MFNFQMFSVWDCFLKSWYLLTKTEEWFNLINVIVTPAANSEVCWKKWPSYKWLFFPLSLKWLVWNCFINAKHAQGRANFDSFFKKKLLAVYWYYSWMVVRNSSELAACLNVNAKLQLRITLWNHPHVDVHSAFLIWRQFCFMAEHLGFNLSKTN